MTYFNNISTLEELKKEYRRLVMLHHPDKGGDTETMKSVNAEHDELFETLKAAQNVRAEADTTGKTRHVDETAEEFRDILEVLIHLDGIEIELCGCWLWISGNTREHKEEIKAAGCHWSNDKKLWYWHPTEAPGTWHKKGRKNEMSQIRSKYGSEIITAAGTRNATLVGATA